MARSFPVTTYSQDGGLVTSTLWNGGPKALNDFLSNRPTFRGTQGVATTVPNNTWTAIRMDQTLIDTDGGHNTIVNNTRYTCQVQGWYWVKGTIGWNGAGTIAFNRSDAAIAVNGNVIAGSATFLDWGPNQTGAFSASCLVFLVVGDVVEVWGRQQTGHSVFFDNNSTGNMCDMNLWLVSS